MASQRPIRAILTTKDSHGAVPVTRSWIDRPERSGQHGASPIEGSGRSLTAAHLGRIVDQSVNEIYVFDAESLQFHMVNRGARANLGYSAEELLGLTPLDLKPEFTRKSFSELLQPLRSGEVERLVFETLHRRRDGSTYDVEVRLQLMQDESPAVFFAIIEDITERKRMQRALQRTNRDLERRVQERTAALRESRERLVAALDASATGTFRHDFRVERSDFDESLLDLLDLRAEERPANLLDFARRVPYAEDREMVIAAAEQCLRDGTDLDIDFRIVRRDGSIRWIAHRGRVFRGATGEPAYMTGACTDITDRKHHEAFQQLLMDELNHRIKNTLAVVMSIAAQTLNHSISREHFEESFLSRLQALAKMHDALSRNMWRKISLRTLIEDILSVFREEDCRHYVIHGHGDAMLSPNQAQSFSLVLHELATNASKYGALSVESGRVAMTLEVGADGDGRTRVSLQWVESDGPVVRPPTRRGFGLRLIESSIAYDLNGQVKLDYPKEGLRCAIDVHLRPDALGSSGETRTRTKSSEPACL